jgi:hypothetical protein
MRLADLHSIALPWLMGNCFYGFRAEVARDVERRQGKWKPSKDYMVDAKYVLSITASEILEVMTCVLGAKIRTESDKTSALYFLYIIISINPSLHQHDEVTQFSHGSFLSHT